MKVENPNDFNLVGFELGKGNKKYNALLQHSVSGRIKRIPFGDRRYEQYEDQIGYYSSQDHKDPKRRSNYLKRHSKTKDNLYSSSWFSANFLW